GRRGGGELRESGRANGAPAGAGPAAAAAIGDERARDPHIHPAANGLMNRRLSHYVVAGTLVAGGLVWAATDAWPWRRPLTARPLMVDAAYVDFTETLGKRETLGDVLARGGVRGRDHRASLAAPKPR